jgi:hypothetical protein
MVISKSPLTYAFCGCHCEDQCLLFCVGFLWTESNLWCECGSTLGHMLHELPVAVPVQHP